MKLFRMLFGKSKGADDQLRNIAAIVDRVEAEMRRIGYWKASAPSELDPVALYAGVSFEEWLQFVFIPSVRQAVKERDLCSIPPYRVGVAALRQYDYHSKIPEAHSLMLLCHELEAALPPL